MRRVVAILALLAVGGAAGAAAILASIEVNRYMSTDAFCTSCHSIAHTGCHDPHATAVKVVDCIACHKEVHRQGVVASHPGQQSRLRRNGDANEGIAQEVEHLRSQLYGAITSYAKTVAKKDIVYNADVFPYFFIDSNGNGTADKEEVRPASKYDVWTPRLLKAAYNYQFVTKEPGAYAHNPTYALQILYDSLADLGAKVSVDVRRAKRP